MGKTGTAMSITRTIYWYSKNGMYLKNKQTLYHKSKLFCKDVPQNKTKKKKKEKRKKKKKT